MLCSPMTTLRRAAFMLALALFAGCGGKPAPPHHAVDTHPEDACAVCGMYLDGSPGPRAEAWVSGRAKPLVFDSTRDFFAYVLQPENQASLQELFVQDSARIDWQQPAHAAASFIDARTASYVAWQPLPGSMGPTLAPFASRAAAEVFKAEHGGAWPYEVEVIAGAEEDAARIGEAETRAGRDLGCNSGERRALTFVERSVGIVGAGQVTHDHAHIERFEG